MASQIKAAKKMLFSENKILHWFVQLALGLHYMHSNKVLHRDLKTQNVFLLGNGRLVLGDLGISKVLDGTVDLAKTCIGTPYYMSPEIFQNKPYGYKADIWALGCVLYEMTTLNHAFDANSLNGLAQKIIKGRYPAINNKYSKHLRDLISSMLLIDPRQRPDLDQILRKPFIKKHCVDFFMDIANRPSAGIGEGTVIIRAAMGGGARDLNNFGSENIMMSLQKQLRELDMWRDVTEAMAPKPLPSDPVEVKKVAKEQSHALKREEEHKRMVQLALEKLNADRENRARARAQQLARGGPVTNNNRGDINNRDSKAAGPKDGNNHAIIKPAVYQPQPIGKVLADKTPSQKDVLPRPSAAAQPNQKNNIFEVEKREREREMERKREADRMAAERERKVIDEKNRALEEAEARQRERSRERAAHEKEIMDDREKVRAKAVAAERERAEAALAKQKGEVARAQAERDVQREKERQRQKQEIEQLKRDKIELDRRASEREQLREQRRQEERKRLDCERKQGLEAVQEKLGVMQDQVHKNLEIFNQGPTRAEQKNGPGDGDNLSARERVLLRKQEKLARAEDERVAALKYAEAENRRIRAVANEQSRSQFHNADGAPSVVGVAPARPSSKEDLTAVEDDVAPPKYKPMDASELHGKLNQINIGGNRFGSNPNPSSAGGISNVDSVVAEPEIDDDDDGVVWSNADAANEGDEEDIEIREEELRQELNMATLRCEELKKTLLETKSILGVNASVDNKRSNSHVAAANAAANNKMKSIIGSDSQLFDDGSDSGSEYSDYGSDEDESNNVPAAAQQGGSKTSSEKSAESKLELRTPRKVKPLNAGGVGESPFIGLQDPPTPTGRLSDRITRLRQRCVEALSRDAFEDAYRFLKQFDENYGGSNLYEDEREEDKLAKMRAILGDGKAHYTPLIEQLIFMEETHSC